MTNYTNVDSNMVGNLTGTIGGGMTNLFGDPLLLGIFGLLIIIILGYTMKVDVDTQILSGVTMIYLLADSSTYLPDWLFWITLIPIGIYGGVVFSRVIHK